MEWSFRSVQKLQKMTEGKSIVAFESYNSLKVVIQASLNVVKLYEILDFGNCCSAAIERG